MGSKSEWLIVRLLSLSTCTKSTEFHGIWVGVFVIGARDVFRLLLFPFAREEAKEYGVARLLRYC